MEGSAGEVPCEALLLCGIFGVVFLSTGLHVQDAPPYLQTQSIHAPTDFGGFYFILAMTAHFSTFFVHLIVLFSYTILSIVSLV